MIFLSSVHAGAAVELLTKNDAHELVGEGEPGKGKGEIAAPEDALAEAVAATDDEDEVGVAAHLPAAKGVGEGEGVELFAADLEGDDEVVVFDVLGEALGFFVLEGADGFVAFLSGIFFVGDGDDLELVIFGEALCVFVDGGLPIFFLDLTDAQEGDIHYSLASVCASRASMVASSGVT